MESEKESLTALKESLQSERAELEKKTYELTQQTYAMEEKQRALLGKETETNASNEELQRQLTDVQNRESELEKNNSKLQDELTSLQLQQKELSSRQSIYNQQQLEFIARKNALAAQQFDFAERLNSYNAQVKVFNENLEKFENERLLFQNEKQRYEESVKEFETQKAKFEEEKTRFDAEKEEVSQAKMDAQKRAIDDASGLQLRINELQERERMLQQRENALNDQYRDLYFGQGYGYNNYQQPSGGYSQQNNHPSFNNHESMQERAQRDGIKLNTAGMRNYQAQPQQRHTNPTPAHHAHAHTHAGHYNVGTTLFKTALIILCIMAFESLAVFFIKDYMGVSALYPVLGFSAGFLVFLACSILYAMHYKPNVRRKKQPSYLLTAAILFVICVVIVSMIAVYFKAQISIPSQLLAYVIVSVAYLANNLLFAIFYYAFSVTSNKR